ncbi:MAG: fructose-1,6-bisphosphatase [Dehalococcoidia bacterium]|jgi:fructose 1,6-bisphosphate aldolase/phosphatase|nr:fructose-1,6-bisphosphatase [Dehalococcoidia bacterium]MDW8009178.1 fructose-1,6-bisphosphate aldolase/phosphatase [Chloroflexota bacterium]
MVTISVIKADVGGFVGHSASHPDVLDTGREELERAKQRGLLIDYHVSYCGDDMFLIMTHDRGEDNEEVHRLAWDTFLKATDVAKKLKLYGAGQDLLADAFSGNIRGAGPGSAEMTIEERPSEPILVFMGDKTSAGAFNLPLYKMFADPFNTPGLVISDPLHHGFTFEVHDVKEHKKIMLNAPEEIYDMLIFLGAPSRYAVKRVFNRSTGNIAAVSSTDKLSLIAGRYVGKDDPTMIVRAQGEFPAVGEVLEPFTNPFIVEGWMRGSHQGPLMPVSLRDAHPSRFDGPSRLVCLGFQLANGKLVGPRDMFDDPGFDEARRKANEVANYLRSLGPFEPHRLPLEEMEYTTMPMVAAKLAERWQPLE